MVEVIKMMDEYYRRNWYKILEVKKDASEEEIKKAKRELMKKYHPDWHPNASEEELKELNEKTNLVLRAWEYYEKNKEFILREIEEEKYGPKENVQDTYRYYRQEQEKQTENKAKEAQVNKEKETNVNDIEAKLIKLMEEYLKGFIKKGKINHNKRYVVIRAGLSLAIHVVKKMYMKKLGIKKEYAEFCKNICDIIDLVEKMNVSNESETKKKIYHLRMKVGRKIKDMFPLLSNRQITHLITRILQTTYIIKQVKKMDISDDKKRTM